MTTQTLVVLLTPPGRSAVASILVTGPAAVALVEALFRPAGTRPLAVSPIDRILFGRWHEPTADPNSGEEVVVARRAEDAVEVHCHGGWAASRAIIDALVARGGHEIAWAEWNQQTAPDRIAHEARLALAAATTQRGAAHLWQQHQGVLRSALDQAIDALDTDPTAAALLLDELLGWAPLGLHLAAPWRVVLTGEPNVGKSSLLNALVGFQRAIVHDVAGTTRDVVTATTALDGWPVELADTAGQRDSSQALEAAGIELARRQLATADLILVVADRSLPWTAASDALLTAWPQALLVANKSDLPAADIWTERPAIGVSARSGAGLAELIGAMVAHLVPRAPALTQALPFTVAQRDAIAAARRQLADGNVHAAQAALRAIC